MIFGSFASLSFMLWASLHVIGWLGERYPSVRLKGISLNIEGEMTPGPPIEFGGQTWEWKALTLMRKLSGLSGHP